jgi:energy-coupling factor transporter ATP-binding protein EcfA2
MATVRTRTYFNNKFITGYRPTQTDYQDLFLTIPMKKEVADRAKVYTGSSSLETEVGLVVLATNTQAKTNATQLTDRSVVLQPHQNNTCVSASDIINSNLATFEGIIVDVTADATPTRNNYVIRLSTLFKSFIGATFDDIAARLLPSQSTHASKYLKTNGTTASWEKVDLSTADSVTGTLPIGSGGTGQTTITNAINGLLPSQGSNSGKFLQTDGTNISWQTGNGDIYKSTSASSVAIGIGAKSFVVGAGLAYQVGVRVRVTDQALSTNFMEGPVTSYSGTTLNFTADTMGGSGTISSWYVNIGSIAVGSWVTITPSNNWQVGSIGITPAYRIVNGYVEFKGSVASDATTTQATFFTLPTSYRFAAGNKNFVCYCSDAAERLGAVTISSNGIMQIDYLPTPFSAGTTEVDIDLSQIRFHIDS